METGIGAHQPVEIVGRETKQPAIAERHDIGIARPPMEQRQLAEEITGAEPDRLWREPHLDRARRDEIHAVAGIALAQDELARQDEARPQQPAYLLARGR